MRLINKTRGCVLAENVELADNFAKRLKGLLGRSGMPEGSTLHIVPCPQIHTFFMRFSIDAAFVDNGGKILNITADMKPWKISAWVLGARSVYEFPSGAIADKAAVGDILELVE